MMLSSGYGSVFRKQPDPSALFRYTFGFSMGMRLLLFLLSFVLPSTMLLAQPGGGSTTLADSGSASKADSVPPLSPIDTLPPYEQNAPPLGAFRPHYTAADNLSDLTKEDFPSNLYFSSIDIVEKKLPALLLSQGMPGLVEGFSYAGADPNRTSILFNGRPLQGAGGGAFDLGLYSPEFLESVEVLQGAEAALYGDAAALLALNLVQPRFNVAGSYLRLAYAQGPGNTTNADITFSRNVAPRTNFVFGFRRLASDGLYANSEVSLWNVRGSLTWHPSAGISFSVTEMFGNETRGSNGGLEPTSSIDPDFASVVNDTLDEHRLRHDMTFAAQWYPGLVESDSVAVDSVTLSKRSRLDGSVYYSHAERSLQVGDELAELPNVPNQVLDDVLGFRGGAYIPLGGVNLHGNLVAELTDGKAGRLHAGGMAELPVGNTVQLFAGVAATRYPDITVISLFGEGRFQLTDSFDFRFTARTFSDDGTSVTGPTGTFSAERSRLLFEGEGRWLDGERYITIGGYARSVASDGTDGKDYWIAGVDASIRLPIAFLVIEQRGVLTIPATNDKRFPQVLSQSDFYVPLSLFKNNLDLRLGAMLEYRTPFAGSEYDPFADQWLYPVDRTRTSQTNVGLLDIYARFRIGSAYIKLTMGNILNGEFWSAYRYPEGGRSLRLGINWALID